MENDLDKRGYGITVFSPDTPPGVKTRKIIFFIIFCVIIMIQACYWLFANSAKPIVLGMPFGMFFIAFQDNNFFSHISCPPFVVSRPPRRPALGQAAAWSK